MLDGLAKYSIPFDEDRSSQRVVMAPSQISVLALWVSTPFKTELRSLVEQRSVAGARFPHSCRRRSSQLQSHVMTHVTASISSRHARA
jgi:hypothetical protein